MAVEKTPCAQCGSTLAADSEACPVCGASIDPVPAEESDDRAAVVAEPAEGGELARRRSRLRQWQDQAEPLGARIAQFPPWAEVAASSGPDPDGWLEVMRGVERLAQRNVVAALEQWERQTKSRLSRLEAYSVDGRLERDQMDDVLHAARTGELSQALTTYQQVDRVVALKERHLDQARDELERLVSLFRDMEALGLDPPVDPGELGDDLERELRSGRLAPLKQQLRALRLQAMNRLKEAVPRYIEPVRGVPRPGAGRGNRRRGGGGRARPRCQGVRGRAPGGGAPKAARSSRRSTARPRRTACRRRPTLEELLEQPDVLFPPVAVEDAGLGEAEAARNISAAAVNRASASTQTEAELLCRAHSTAAVASAVPTPSRRASGSTTRWTTRQEPSLSSQPTAPSIRPSRRAAKYVTPSIQLVNSSGVGAQRLHHLGGELGAERLPDALVQRADLRDVLVGQPLDGDRRFSVDFAGADGRAGVAPAPNLPVPPLVLPRRIPTAVHARLST